MQSEEPTIIQSLENHLAEYGHTTVGQDIAAVILVIKDLHQKATLSAQVQDVAGWQPIETAPKDGTRLLLMWEPFSGMSEHVELGKWNVRNGWVNTYGHAFSGSPTHFMPLPTALAKQEG